MRVVTLANALGACGMELPPALRKRGVRLLEAKRFGGSKRPRFENPTIAGVEDVVNQPIYDSFSVAQAAAFPNVTTLFSGGAAGRPLAQTNMQVAGQLPAPQRLFLMAYRIYVGNDTVPADLIAWQRNTSNIFEIGTKPYWEGPSFMLSAGAGALISAVAQIGTAPSGAAPVIATSNGSLDQRSIFSLTQPFMLEQGEAFKWTVRADIGFNLTANSANPAGTGMTIYVILDGELYRGVQ